MTPKEKALDLISKMNCEWNNPDDLAPIPDHEKSIHCALITVEEIIKDIPMYLGNINPKYVYWAEVKKELENL